MEHLNPYLALWFSSFLNVFLLGSQSKNVMHSRYLAAAATSFGITIAQFFFVRVAATGDPITAIAVSGSAGSFGICAAIFISDHFRKRDQNHHG